LQTNLVDFLLLVSSGLAVRFCRVAVRSGGVLVCLVCVLSRGLMVARFMVLRRFMVRLGCMLVVFGCFLVCFVCHDFPRLRV
jgi:hypothetical protein